MSNQKPLAKSANHIELFSGCGGLSLGLERAGFKLVFANELSPMAGETFAYNLLKEDLELLAKQGKQSIKTRWISSKFDDLTSRLRENPLEYPELGKGVSDISGDTEPIKDQLFIGNIIHLNQLLESQPNLLEKIKTGGGENGIDLVSGGPPCQSFSLAGLREKNCAKNSLPWEFAKFVGLVKPKFVILENVSGILRPFKENGISYHAWFEVAKSFAAKGYIPLSLHLNARLTGVPQNRPRFVMIGVRSDIFKSISSKFNQSEHLLFEPCVNLFKKVKSTEVANINDYKYFDTKREQDLTLFKSSFLSHLVSHKEVCVKHAIHDLMFTKAVKKSTFVSELNSNFAPILGQIKSITNHEPRKNGDLVKRRFKIYQILKKCSKNTERQVFDILKEKTSTLSESAWDELRPHDYVSSKKTLIKFNTKTDLINYFLIHRTKKQTQRALIASEPSPAALSIPDDACHYDKNELRTLTVREMARIQSFPDAFTFRSKITTGGKMRQFEVPQYTQVGNAVPPLLGLQIGNSVLDLLKKISN